MKAYKGFNKDLTCRDFQYKEGETFKMNETPRACQEGFHACEYPLDVFGYYKPAESVFHEVEILGEVDKDSDDSKVSTNQIKIGAELNLGGIAKASIEYITSRTKKDNKKISHRTDNQSAASNTGYQSAASNTGDYSAASNTGNRSAASNTGNYSAASNTGNRSAASNTGYQSAASNTGNYSAASNTGNRSAASNTGNYSAASNTGNRSAASNTGDYSAASNTGKDGVAASFGIEGRAKGAIGCWIICAEWEKDGNRNWHRKDIQVAKVDGEIIKENTYYILKDGKFVEYMEEQ